MHVKDLYVITYGSKYAIRFQKGANLKLHDTQELAIANAWMHARQYDAEVYIEVKYGKYRKAKKPADY